MALNPPYLFFWFVVFVFFVPFLPLFLIGEHCFSLNRAFFVYF